MKRHIFALVPTALFALLLPVIASADTLTLATVDCGDGSPLTAAVDLGTLTQLQASIQGMLDNPAGLTCRLSTSPLLAASGGSSSNPFVVGGGSYHFLLGGTGNTQCTTNFSLNAHVDSTGFHGEQTFNVPNTPGCSGVAGLIKANVACLRVNTTGPAPIAQITGFITAVTGSEARGLSVGDELGADVTDNGPPSSGTPDQIFQWALPSGNASLCVANPGFDKVDNGNITIHA
jgi:hypothetical protein